MRTEEELIYTIWDIVRGGKFNQDDTLTERLLRSFLRIHRGKILSRAYAQGSTITDEVFQNLGPLSLQLHQSDEFITVSPLPKTIRLSNYGFMCDIDGHEIPVIHSEEYFNEKRNPRNFNPMMKYVNDKLHLWKGRIQRSELEGFYDTSLNTVVRKLDDPALEANQSVNVSAVLVNPDDGIGYDFTASPYPMPDELIEEMINSVNAREFNLFLRMKSDQIGNLENEANPTGDQREV